MLRFIDIEESLDGVSRLPNGEQGPAQGPYTPVNRYGDSYMPDGREPGAPAPAPIRQVQRQLGTEVAQTADLGQAYQAADRALGGILPGGGVAGPLTDAARAVSESIPIIDMVSPASGNFYRDRVEADRQRGERIATETRQELDAADIGNLDEATRTELVERTQAGEAEAALRGVVMSHDGRMLSTREEFESDRDFYLRNQGYREDERALEIGRRLEYQTQGRDYRRQDELMERGEHPTQLRQKSETEGVSWASKIADAEGMSTADGPEAGSLGCVHGVNKVIESAGLEAPWTDPATGKPSVYIPYVTNWITSNGGSKVGFEEAKPGDIVVADGAHMGILTDQNDGNGTPVVLSNSSSRASMTWIFPLSENFEIYRVPQLQR